MTWTMGPGLNTCSASLLTANPMKLRVCYSEIEAHESWLPRNSGALRNWSPCLSFHKTSESHVVLSEKMQQLSAWIKESEGRETSPLLVPKTVLPLRRG